MIFLQARKSSAILRTVTGVVVSASKKFSMIFADPWNQIDRRAALEK